MAPAPGIPVHDHCYARGSLHKLLVGFTVYKAVWQPSLGPTCSHCFLWMVLSAAEGVWATQERGQRRD